MNNSETDILSFFEEECEGDDETSDRTPRTQQGDREDALAAEEQKNTLREKEFRALMEGEYKDLFTAYFQQTFNRRFKEYKQIKTEMETSRAVLDVLRERFGDLSGKELLDAIRADTSLKSAPTEAQMPFPEAQKALTEKDVEKACAEAERRMLSHIRARGMRPAENGVNTQSVFAAGIARMTREERAEVAKRAERGEKIVF